MDFCWCITYRSFFQSSRFNGAIQYHNKWLLDLNSSHTIMQLFTQAVLSGHQEAKYNNHNEIPSSKK